MAPALAGVPHSPLGVEECAPVHSGAELQLQYPEMSLDVRRRVLRESRAHARQVSSTGSGDYLRDSVLRIDNANRILRLESLVHVIVPVQDQVRVCFVE